MRYAIVKNGKVVNVAVANYPLTAEWVVIPAGCPVAIGDTYTDGVFYAPDGKMRMTPEAEILYKRLEAIESSIREEYASK